MGICLFLVTIPLIQLEDIRGEQSLIFIMLFFLAFLFYIVAVILIRKDRPALWTIWVIAISVRLLWLTTEPVLSDDVFRYIWDGHLVNNGINPYAYIVQSPLLDVFSIPAREMVNNDWMASPYLPAAQAYFSLLTRLLPQNTRVFQISAIIFDLAAGWLILKMLPDFKILPQAIIIYLWNPLVIIEFSHAAHIDAFMNFLALSAVWFLIRSNHKPPRSSRIYTNISFLLFGAAVMTKGLPILFMPLFLRNWGWKKTIMFGLALLFLLTITTINIGWGLTGSLEGTGLFGATRIYAQYWKFNPGIIALLEHLLVSLSTRVMPDMIAGILRFLAGLSVLASLGIVGKKIWSLSENLTPANYLLMIRLSLIPIGVYFLTTYTLHPWYLSTLLLFLPFLYTSQCETLPANHFIWPWAALSALIVLTYLSYSPENKGLLPILPWLEYVPFYILFIRAILATRNTRIRTFFV